MLISLPDRIGVQGIWNAWNPCTSCFFCEFILDIPGVVSFAALLFIGEIHFRATARKPAPRKDVRLRGKNSSPPFIEKDFNDETCLDCPLLRDSHYLYPYDPIRSL